LARVKKKVIAISPIEGKQAFSGPASKYMKALKLDISPVGIAKFYSDIIGSIVISKADRAYEGILKKLGLNVYLNNIAMNSFYEERRLAELVAGIT
jgi:LPPG:FO 2-phospho-L-lactate transferase